ncbi:MAG: hypothetical protein ABI299_12455 [Rhodanobacter sp.]
MTNEIIGGSYATQGDAAIIKFAAMPTAAGATSLKVRAGLSVVSRNQPRPA